jgi:hypothetical protein
MTLYLCIGVVAFCGVAVAVFYLGAFRTGGYQDMSNVLAYAGGMATRCVRHCIQHAMG